jgi:hypothetical protein
MSNLKDQKKKDALYNAFLATENKRMQFAKFYSFIEINWGATVDDAVQE